MLFLLFIFKLSPVLAIELGENCQATEKFSNRIHYMDVGQGPPIILIHGAASNLREFVANGLIEELSQKHRVIAFDRPGMGWSKPYEVSGQNAIEVQVELIHQFLQNLDLQSEALLVGHSLGGAIAAGLLVLNQKIFRGFVGLAPAVSPVGPGSSWYTKVATIPILGSFFSRFLVPLVGPKMMEKRLKVNFGKASVPQTYMTKSCLKLVFRPEAFGSNSRDLNEIYDYHKMIYPKYKTIKKPATLIFSKDDSVIDTYGHANKFKDMVPQTKVIYLDNTGHLPQYTHKDLILEEIQKFF